VVAGEPWPACKPCDALGNSAGDVNGICLSQGSGPAATCSECINITPGGRRLLKTPSVELL
jgi:hypothetical protein